MQIHNQRTKKLPLLEDATEAREVGNVTGDTHI